MKTKDYYYTQDEDNVIMECVKRNPQNLTEAFKKAERLLENRSFNGIVNRWYKYLSKKSETKCFITIGVNSKNNNRKIVTTNTSDNTEFIKETIWQKIMKLFK